MPVVLGGLLGVAKVSAVAVLPGVTGAGLLGSEGWILANSKDGLLMDSEEIDDKGLLPDNDLDIGVWHDT